MALRVSIVASGAPPFVRAYDKAPIATPVEDGTGVPITLVDAGAPPLVFVNADGSPYAGPGVNDLLLETGDHLLMETGDAILLEAA